MKRVAAIFVLTLILPIQAFAQESAGYEFKGGYPTPETIRKAYDDADLSRAIEAYKFFYPTVSFEATWRGNLKEGAVANQIFPLLEGTPNQLVFTIRTRPIPACHSTSVPVRWLSSFRPGHSWALRMISISDG